jgi:hypothetical protein
MQDGNSFGKGLQLYLTTRMGDLDRKLEAVDAGNRQKTEITLKELKEEAIGEARSVFGKEKEKHLQMLGKISEDSGK